MNPSAPVPVAPALAWCLHLLVVGLLALAAGRAVLTGQPNAALVGALCAAVGVAYAVGPLTPSVGVVPRATAAWLTSVSVLWLALLAASADGIWIAFPLFFLYLHLLPRRAGLAAVILATAAAITGFAVHQGALAVGTVIGPALGAAVAVAVVWGYQALHHQSDERRRLIDQLTDARADLAAAQHAAGVLAERERLGREIHDTLAQGLASIQLLLRAAGRALPTDADKAGGYVEQARATAADNLAEARRFVAALSPPA
ncbi:MAG TPA: histidine kinase dimerization/phosphoacceptor domain-containing protein, partial [Actinokineospora sp.]|nr:histidine kinase dimerization/phosphoacceptor domain-containing protein [Actinokineospora sp.]